jgi:hypothetical protein
MLGAVPLPGFTEGITREILKSFGNIHLAWPREGAHPNAVYLCPWPYRPTAVVRGLFESWANELAKREGFSNLYYQE